MLKLTLGWLYYDLMNTYGDRGNIMALVHRAKIFGIQLEVTQLSISSTPAEIAKCDLYMMGGAEDRQQELVTKDFLGDKKKVLEEKIHRGTPGIYICGAFQFLGKYYETADKHRLECLDILPLYTESAKQGEKRLIGDIVVKLSNSDLLQNYPFNNAEVNKNYYEPQLLVGFENHGGRTFIDAKEKALGKPLKGFGNNGSKETEGYVYLNTLCTYLHGPLLPKNPQITDFLLEKALQVKYNRPVSLPQADNELENKARAYLLKKLDVQI